MPGDVENVHGTALGVCRFGGFVFDPKVGELRKHGSRLRLSGQSFEILRLLLQRPGELVAREELQLRLWADGTNVDFEHGLNAAINKLRETLADSPERPRFIETLPRRGYRFIAPVQAGPSTPLPWSARETRRRIRSLAVLPLENLSGDPEQEYFAEGMTEALITDLAKVSALRVISRTSAMRYKGARKSLPDIALELRVDGVVEGTVLRVGERVRISAQLVHAPSDTHLWAETYERDLRDVFALQAEVARAIAAEIRIQVTPRERKGFRQSRRVRPESHEAYLKGRFHWNRRTPESLRKSLRYFDEAIAIDPDYALAYVGIADAHVMLGSFLAAIPPLEAMPKARAAALKALEIDRSLGEAHASLAFIRAIYDYEWEKAEREFRRAVALNPGYATAHHWYAVCLRCQGKLSQAQSEIERAHELDPLSLQINTEMASLSYFQRAYDKAIEQARKVLEFDPNLFYAHLTVALTYIQKGMLAEALAEGENLAVSWGRLCCTGACYAAMGKKTEARRIAEELQELAKHEIVSPVASTWVYAYLRDTEATLTRLEKAYLQRWSFLPIIKVDPAFDFLRADPRFRDLQRRIGLE